MNPVPISEDVQRFILLAIPSVPYLEALLLMRSAPDRAWDASQIARQLYLSDNVGAGLLAELTAAGVVSPDPQHADCYRYRPQSEQLAEKINLLAIIYSRNLIGVSNLIHAKSSKKAQQFVDAFILRRKP
jgi:hypothetical protein